MARGVLREALIIDEAQQLRLEALNAIRGLYDSAGVPIVFVGNADVINRFYNKRRQVIPALEQLQSRLAITVRLGNSSSDEVVAVAQHFGVNDPRAHAFLVGEAKRSGVGNLRRLEHLFITVRERNGDLAEITLKHLKDASEVLGS